MSAQAVVLLGLGFCKRRLEWIFSIDDKLFRAAFPFHPFRVGFQAEAYFSVFSFFLFFAPLCPLLEVLFMVLALILGF